MSEVGILSVVMEVEVVGQKRINRNGGEYYNGKALSQEKREKILEKWFEGQNVTSIARDLKITHGVVSKIIRQYKATKSVLPKIRSPNSFKNKIKKPTRTGFSMEEILAPSFPQQRLMFSKNQIETLTEFYGRNKYPSEDEKKTLSRETSLSVEQVTVSSFSVKDSQIP
ncbi:hypothetical protein FO519_008747 [Halicephalobus sp. NKZ332]|nr:hypothetical protein FO519_008747 [Halicephalobus sp. NKZ332]